MKNGELSAVQLNAVFRLALAEYACPQFLYDFERLRDASLTLGRTKGEVLDDVNGIVENLRKCRIESFKPVHKSDKKRLQGKRFRRKKV